MIGELTILGALASVLVQWLKQKGQSKLFSLTVLVVVSVVLAVGAWFIQEYGFWELFLGIMASASLIYSFLIQHLEKIDFSELD